MSTKPNSLSPTPEQLAKFQAVAATRAQRDAPTFLTIDDQRMSITLMQKVLPPPNILHTSLRAREGFDLYLEHAPDILWLDMILPEFNGLQLTKAICDFDPDAYIVMVTANEVSEVGAQAKRAGAKSLITKPYSKKLIHDTIERYLRDNPSRRNILANVS